MAFTEEDCEAMIHATDDAGVKLMIAYRLHFERGNLDSIEVLKQGTIGNPRIFTSIFSQQVKEGNNRLQGDVGGGPLYDMGIYCINAARYLFQSEPTEVFGWNNTDPDDPRFREVPEMTTGLMRFPGERIAHFSTSFGAADRSVFEVIGTKGALKMDPAYELAEALKSEITFQGKPIKKNFSKRDQFAPELSSPEKLVSFAKSYGIRYIVVRANESGKVLGGAPDFGQNAALFAKTNEIVAANNYGSPGGTITIYRYVESAAEPNPDVVIRSRMLGKTLKLRF